MKVKVNINILNLIGAGAAAVVSYMTLTGQILEYIKFSDVLGEIGFCLLSGMLAIGLAYSSFERIK
jgi:hypothetical protein